MKTHYRCNDSVNNKHYHKEPRALNQLFGLQILMENQNVATG